jgi:transposase-like protein
MLLRASFQRRNRLPFGCPSSKKFHQHLRALAQSAVRTVLELVMREELDAFIGAAWGECSPKRKGYRNGAEESTDSLLYQGQVHVTVA